MDTQVAFFASIGLSLIAWSIVVSRYVWPRLRVLPRAEALQPVLILHSFRFAGLAFLVPGVVSPELPSAFAQAAAYGDIVAATLALMALVTQRRGLGVLFVWIFNLWGTADLLNAFYQANRTGLAAGQLGATYFIPTLIVPLLLITHAIVFRVLLQHSRAAEVRDAKRGAQVASLTTAKGRP